LRHPYTKTRNKVLIGYQLSIIIINQKQNNKIITKTYLLTEDIFFSPVEVYTPKEAEAQTASTNSRLNQLDDFVQSASNQLQIKSSTKINYHI
jgi:hypothetical protein